MAQFSIPGAPFTGLSSMHTDFAVNARIGQGGIRHQDGAGVLNADENGYVGFIALAASTITTTAPTQAADGWDGGDALSAVSVPAGTEVWGPFKTIEVVTAGEIIAYRR